MKLKIKKTWISKLICGKKRGRYGKLKMRDFRIR